MQKRKKRNSSQPISSPSMSGVAKQSVMAALVSSPALVYGRWCPFTPPCLLWYRRASSLHCTAPSSSFFVMALRRRWRTAFRKSQASVVVYTPWLERRCDRFLLRVGTGLFRSLLFLSNCRQRAPDLSSLTSFVTGNRCMACCWRAAENQPVMQKLQEKP